MTQSMRDGLQYVKNAHGGATMKTFIEDFAPIGSYIWVEIFPGCIEFIEGGHIVLNAEGERLLIGADAEVVTP